MSKWLKLSYLTLLVLIYLLINADVNKRIIMSGTRLSGLLSA